MANAKKINDDVVAKVMGSDEKWGGPDLFKNTQTTEFQPIPSIVEITCTPGSKSDYYYLLATGIIEFNLSLPKVYDKNTYPSFGIKNGNITLETKKSKNDLTNINDFLKILRNETDDIVIDTNTGTILFKGMEFKFKQGSVKIINGSVETSIDFKIKSV